jgi:DNA invertase Pin-like site-specific DNA recombinase
MRLQRLPRARPFSSACVSERTRAGMQAAKRRSRHVGRPRKLTHQIDHARQLMAERKETQAGATALLGVGVATLRRGLNGLNDPSGLWQGKILRPLYGPEI